MKKGLCFVCGAFFLLSGCYIAPKPLQHKDLLQVTRSASAYYVRQEPINKAIDIYEAVARALKYNLDHRADIMREMIRYRSIRLSGHHSFPSLVLHAQHYDIPYYNDRLVKYDSEIKLSWNILDFGLSYARVRQAADKFLLQREISRKTLNKIVDDVRVAYWRAVASENLLDRLKELEGDTHRAVLNARTLLREGKTAPLAAVAYERDILEIRREIQEVNGHLELAKRQLAALMSIPQNQTFSLNKEKIIPDSKHLSVSINDLFRLALMNRPEIREIAYEFRINEREAQANFISFFPSTELSLSENVEKIKGGFDFLGFATRASWNLVKLFQYPDQKKLAREEKELLRVRSAATFLSVMTQVYLSRSQYIHAQKEFNTVKELLDAQKNYLRLLEASALSDIVSDQNLIMEKLKTILAEVRYDKAYADLQGAYAAVYLSLGFDAYPSIDIEKSNLKEISSALRQTWIKYIPLRQMIHPPLKVDEKKSLSNPKKTMFFLNKKKMKLKNQVVPLKGASNFKKA